MDTSNIHSDDGNLASDISQLCLTCFNDVVELVL